MGRYHVSAKKTVTRGSAKSEGQVGIVVTANSAAEAKAKARQQFFRDGTYEKYTNLTVKSI